MRNPPTAPDHRLDTRISIWAMPVLFLVLTGPAAAQSDPDALPPARIVTEDQVPAMLADGWQRLASDPRVLFKDVNGNGAIDIPDEIWGVVANPEQ